MDIYIYSDESGVFDAKHNRYFVFAGTVFLSKKDKEKWERLYLHNERTVRNSESLMPGEEVKATTVSNKSKNKLYRSLNRVEKFGIVISEKDVLDNIFDDKKSKQRYLDYAYKIGVKRKLQHLIDIGKIDPSKVRSIHFFVDEHTTATNGRYELREGLEQEFRIGTYNWKYTAFFPPIFPNLSILTLSFCDSRTKTLVRTADIVANRLFFCVITNKVPKMLRSNFQVVYLPK
ncbi:Putative uncharacterized protein [Lactobacillus equicursoris DSM 19284 = JCM 14600 = CIP 110162]|uniref:DUF3800 domain-containing protein n=1 Tax=Lactobacillus equicursoris DSM 19284 = JCM 14600 = CIP 110162 TaxID=1293597 RepID=K0NXC1_9LACO|nr:DUF3800 domain-containing protein [Lactobacillus equicursoris]KRL00004.1 hypothetical protein FC20_GL001639 [Lactobacillus equicursoris DSM 19284 = JCM 14600 = CIP 110162]CCK86418.1 Putative uncharacterized protein [Lactobacillus equicursoris DSM 19284 = JCM 14600 = CIP 110162]